MHRIRQCLRGQSEKSVLPSVTEDATQRTIAAPLRELDLESQTETRGLHKDSKILSKNAPEILILFVFGDLARKGP